MDRQHAFVTLLGVRIDDVLLDEAVATIAGWIVERQPHQVATVNPEFVMTAQHNATFRAVLHKADLAVPDGTGLLIAARLTHQRLRQRVTGVELTLQLAQLSARRGDRIFLLGAAPGVAEKTATILEQRFPGVQIVGCHAGSPQPEEEAAICEIVRAAHPDVLLVAYGAPAQDLWIARNQPHLRIPVAIGVGGTFDEIAGVVQPTPAWIQRLGLKWLHRLIQQPSRWRRIWTAVVRFPVAVLRQQVLSK